jgi:hypothetical protein
MTIADIRVFANVTGRQAEEAFSRQMAESDRRIDAQLKATRLRYPERPAIVFSAGAAGRQLT